MSRSKSIPGSKPSRSKTSKEQADSGVAANVSEAKANTETTAEVASGSAAGVEVKTVERKSSLAAAAGANGGSDSNANADGRKFEVMKSEPRKNLVPINLEDEIRRRAYEIYEQRGTSAGSESEDWLMAEREVRQRYHQYSA
jgi:hypothetical protein